MRLLIINPNSSQSITDGIKQVLVPYTSERLNLEYYTAPSDAPDSINDITTSTETAVACLHDMVKRDMISSYDGLLVCCFSDHPLIHMLREVIIKQGSSIPVLGMFEAGIMQALVTGRRFGVLSTGFGYKPNLINGIRTFMGGNTERFVGVITSGLGVVQLREGDQSEVKTKMISTAGKVAALGGGLDAIMLGCSGMSGMEEWVQEGVKKAGFPPVVVIDGIKAGVQFLSALVELGK